MEEGDEEEDIENCLEWAISENSRRCGLERALVRICMSIPTFARAVSSGSTPTLDK